MNTNHGMPTVITYGSHYGSTEHYARKFAEHTGFPVFPYREVNGLSAYARELLDAAGCADIDVFWNGEPVEPVEAIMKAAGLRGASSESGEAAGS